MKRTSEGKRTLVGLLGRLAAQKRPGALPIDALAMLSDRLCQLAQASEEQVLQLLDATRDGLFRAEAERRLRHYGLNQVQHESTSRGWRQLASAFVNPFIMVLLVLGGVSLATDVLAATAGERHFTTLLILGVMILSSALLRFWQEFRSQRATEQLGAMVYTTAAVLRLPGHVKTELPMFKLVPGDIVYLAAGDMIPADVRVLSSKDLFVSQAALTGSLRRLKSRSGCERRHHSCCRSPVGRRGTP